MGRTSPAGRRSVGTAGRRGRRWLVRGMAGLGLSLFGASLLASCRGLSTLVPAPSAPGRVPRLGYLDLSSQPSGPSSPATANTETFLEGLREHSYLEGQNVAIEWRWAERLEQLPDLANELVGLKVDLIVAVANPAARSARRATSTIPIVMPVVGNAVEQGLVASLSWPGGNVTGLNVPYPSLATK